MRLLKYFMVSVGIILIPLAFTSAQETLVLDALINEAKEHNPELIAMQNRYEAARARIPQAKTLDDPVISLSFQKAKKNPVNLSTTEGMERMLSFSQMFPWFGKLPLKGKIALVESQMIASEYKNKELEIINAVKAAYYDLFMNYKETELKQSSQIFLEDLARIAEAKYVVGEIAQEDIIKINIEIAGLATDIANLQKERLVKETRINSLLNREPDSPLGNTFCSEDDIVFKGEMGSLYKLTLQNQPELLMFSYAIEKNKYAKSLAKEVSSRT